MGGVPSLAYAAASPVAALVLLALVLLALVLPAGLGAAAIDLAIDPTSMWMPPTAMIKPTFWDGVIDDDSQRYSSLLVPELPVQSGKRRGGCAR
jgi:hypothetical protein